MFFSILRQLSSRGQRRVRPSLMHEDICAKSQETPSGLPENSVHWWGMGGGVKKGQGQADNAQTLPLATAVISMEPLGETIFHPGFKLSTSLGHCDSSVIEFRHYRGKENV